jgi:hypothetical protein
MPASQRDLPSAVERLLNAGRGVVSTAECQQLGITHDRIHRLCGRGRLVRLASGVYASAEAYHAAGPWERFALRSRAFVLACGPGAYAAGWSAVAVYGLPAIGAPPESPVVVVPRAEGSDTNSAFGRVRMAGLPTSQCAVFASCPVTSMARTVVDVSRTAPREDALVVADAALGRGVKRDDLRSTLDGMRGWPGIRRARWVVGHADPFSESPLETLGRLTFIEAGLPVPLSNVWIGDPPLGYRVDHLVADRWIAFEGDGSLKYDGRLDRGKVIAEQREREWRLRELGLDIVRYDWRLARHDRRRLASRFRSVIAARPQRERPCPWWRQL